MSISDFRKHVSRLSLFWEAATPGEIPFRVDFSPTNPLRPNPTRYNRIITSQEDGGKAAQGPLEHNERLSRDFLPYNGLWIASDKVLGRLFCGNDPLILYNK
jgi:hypothetical protein